VSTPAPPGGAAARAACAAEVLVVGGGPAGVAAALACARRGHEVLLVDRARFPRDKPCGEGLLPQAMRALDRLGLGERVRRLALPLDRLGFAVVGGPEASAELCGADGEPAPGWGVTRLQLDATLLEAARTEPGVTVLEGVAATAPLTDGTRVRGVATTVGPIAARAVVIADGLRSRLRAALGLERGPHRRPRLGLRVHLEVPRLPWGRAVQVLIEPGLEHYLTPVGPHMLEVAVLGEARVFARAQLAAPTLLRHLRAHPVLGAALDGAEPLGPPLGRALGAGPFRQRARRLVLDGALLAGDAASYLDAITGEGIGLALESGRAAGETVAAALAAGRSDARALASFAPAHARIVRDADRLTTLVLLLVRFPSLARRAVSALARHPALFQRLLQVQAGAPFATLPPRDWARLVTG
jgi:flavin-dependent dehydrogenase